MFLLLRSPVKQRLEDYWERQISTCLDGLLTQPASPLRFTFTDWGRI